MTTRKIMLVTKSSESNSEVKVLSSEKGNNIKIKEHLAEFLKVELGVVNVKKFDKGLIDFTNEQISSLIESLISNKILEVGVGNHPKVMFIETDSGYKEYSIFNITSNDPIFIADGNNSLTEAEKEKYKNCDFQFTDEHGVNKLKEEMQFLITSVNNISYRKNMIHSGHLTKQNIENSLLFSNEFLSSFNDLSGKLVNLHIGKEESINGSLFQMRKISYSKNSKLPVEIPAITALYTAPEKTILSIEDFMEFLLGVDDKPDDERLSLEVLNKYFFSNNTSTDTYWFNSDRSIDCKEGIRIADCKNPNISTVIRSNISLGEIAFSAFIAESDLRVVVFEDPKYYSILKVRSGVAEKVLVAENSGLALNSFMETIQNELEVYTGNDKLLAKDVHDLLTIYGRGSFGEMNTSEILLKLKC